MHPIVWSIGPLVVYTYGVLLVAGFLLAMKLAARVLRALPASQRPVTEEQLVDVLCLGLFGGLVGGRLVYIALHWPLFVASPLEVFAIWHGGLVWYGGFAGGLLTVRWYARRHRVDLIRLLDFVVPFLALGHAVGRIGCFFNGCCYGKPTTSWCGVRFPGHDRPVVPTQLLEAGALLGLYLLLRWLQGSAAGRRQGAVTAAYLTGYGIIRFLIEELRGDQPVFWASFTLQQVISVGLIIGGLLLYRTWHEPTSS